jgi:hypothetical protein
MHHQEEDNGNKDMNDLIGFEKPFDILSLDHKTLVIMRGTILRIPHT